MSREAHVRFCESLGLQCPGPLTERARQTKRRSVIPRVRNAVVGAHREGYRRTVLGH